MSELKLQQCRLDGRYDILDCLGRGSYSEIYVARDMGAADGAPQMVVIKALNPSLQGAPDAELERTLIGNFRNEAMALDRVRHPNVINRLGHGTALDLQNRTFHYLVLEYLPGGDLQALCRHHSLTLQQTLYYFEQVADGLEHAHGQQVIHRDIKPSNLLLTADHKTVKIADFGVAKIDSVEGAITRVGTDVYAAPEHHPLMQTGPLDINALTRPKPHLTPAADVYSLAKTVYMLLTGEAPRRFSQRPITELPPSVAGEAWAEFVLRVLRRATALNSAERYQTVGEFREELRDATMPRTQLLSGTDGASLLSPQPDAQTGHARASFSNLSPHAPPPVSFETPSHPSPREAQQASRPRIVVPVASEKPAAVPQSIPQPEAARPLAHVPVTRAVAAATAAVESQNYQPARLSGRARRWLVALLLIAAFAVMLLATHNYVRGVRFGSIRTTPTRTTTTTATAAEATLVGTEYVATTDLNMRRRPSERSERVGRIGEESRVRVVSVNGNWLEVEVVERQTPDDEVADSASRGWINRKFLRTK